MNKKIKRALAVVLAAGLACGGIYGGLLAYRRTNTSPVNVYSVSEIAQNTYYYYDEEQSYGSVSSDRVQSCFLSSSQTVKEVLVTQGQEVKKGDALYTFDTTLTDIQLARAENDYEQQKLTLQHAQEDLEKINRLRPSSEASGDGGGEEAPEEPESTPEEPEYYDPEETNRLIGGSGTKLDPYVFLWSFNDILSDEELIYLFHGGQVPETGTTASEEGGAASVAAFRMWNPFVTDVFADEPMEENDDVYFEDIDDYYIEDDSGGGTYFEDVDEDTGNDDSTWFEDDEEPDDDSGQNGGDELPDDETQIPDGGEPGVDSATEPTDSALTPEEETDSTISSVDSTVTDIGDDMDVFVVLEVHQNDNSEAPLLVKYGLHMFRVSNRISVRLYNPDEQEDDGSADEWEAEGGEEEEGGFDDYGDVDYGDAGEGAAEGSTDSIPTLGKTEIDMNAAYTAKEISDMKAEKEKEIRDTTIAVKKAEITLREMKAEMSDGTVRSKLNGIVKTVRDPDDAYNTSSAVVQVSGGGGYYINFNVSELDLADLDLGQEVTVNSYENGEEYVGSISSISEYPNSSSYFFGGSGNPNSSFYPCKVYISDDAEMRDDDFVGISYSKQTEDSGLFIENMFVRTAANGNYVYVQDEDGKLRKRTVQVGKLTNEATEIRSGITESDYIAFPYGADCVDGAATKQSNYEALYGGNYG